MNEGLKSYCEGSSHFVDLWNGLPFGSLPTEEREKYWVDGLHMSPRGYDKMAGLIFDCTSDILCFTITVFHNR